MINCFQPGKQYQPFLLLDFFDNTDQYRYANRIDDVRAGEIYDELIRPFCQKGITNLLQIFTLNFIDIVLGVQHDDIVNFLIIFVLVAHSRFSPFPGRYFTRTILAPLLSVSSLTSSIRPFINSMPHPLLWGSPDAGSVRDPGAGILSKSAPLFCTWTTSLSSPTTNLRYTLLPLILQCSKALMHASTSAAFIRETASSSKPIQAP